MSEMEQAKGISKKQGKVTDFLRHTGPSRSKIGKRYIQWINDDDKTLLNTSLRGFSVINTNYVKTSDKVMYV